MKKSINYALVEEKRPPLYTCMKYWGKKPHNIWSTYIDTYTPKKGIYLDPFTGSAMSAFESFFANRKCCAFDINPLTSFLIETITSEYNEEQFVNEVRRISELVINDYLYNKLYCYRENGVVHNVKWNSGVIYEVCIEGKKRNDRKRLSPELIDFEALNCDIDFKNLMFPVAKFRNSDSFSTSFLSDIGCSYDKLYTKRNLYVLSLIFNEICSVNNEALKKQLLFGFLQTVHLSTKMCVPRSKSANRDFSTSWGRSAFISSKKQMEMNPLLLFENSCIGKQSVQSALGYFNTTKKRNPIIANVDTEKFDVNKKVDIWYGIVDSKKLDKILPEKSISFVLTDPPYGGLVQYLDLSSVWLSWLWLIDKKYYPSYIDEVTVGKDKTIEDYSNDLGVVLEKVNKVLTDDGTLILTFNNKNIKIWSALLKSISSSGFIIEKVIYQPNKRSGESNVNDPNGVSASDYYIRCKKVSSSSLKVLNEKDLDLILLGTIIEIIEKRNEPTPYQILFNGFICKISQLGLDLSFTDSFLYDFLKKHNGRELVMEANNNNRAGDYWWIANKKINKSNTLTQKVEQCVLKLLEKYEIIKYEDLIRYIYKKFPNGLTPDSDTIQDIIKKLAIERNGILKRRDT